MSKYYSLETYFSTYQYCTYKRKDILEYIFLKTIKKQLDNAVATLCVENGLSLKIKFRDQFVVIIHIIQFTFWK